MDNRSGWKLIYREPDKGFQGYRQDPLKIIFEFSWAFLLSEGKVWIVIALWLGAPANCSSLACSMPSSIAAAGPSFHWDYSLAQHSRLLWKSSAEKWSLGTQIQVAVHPATHGKESAAEKSLFPELFLLLLLQIIRAASLMFQEKMTHSTKKDAASLFSTVKRKYPFRDIYIQLMAGEMWPLFHGGRSVQ